MRGFTKDLDKLLPAFKKYTLIEKQQNTLPVSENDIFEDEDAKFKPSSLRKARLKFLREIYGRKAIKKLHPEEVYVKCNDIIKFMKSENLINKSSYTVRVLNSSQNNHTNIIKYDEYTLSQEGLTKAAELERIITAKRSLIVSIISLSLSVLALSVTALKG